MGKASVAIVDDHVAVCAGLRAIIDAQPDMQVTSESHSGGRALDALRTRPADVVLLDIQLGDVSGVDVLREVRQTHPNSRVLMLSAYPETQFGMNALRAGASGFVNKSAHGSEIVRAIRTVMRGGRFLGPDLAEQLLTCVNGDPDAPLHGRLSPREYQIFSRLAAGESTSDIASTMTLSVKTVSTYRRRVLDKLSMKNNAELTAYALRNQIIQ